MRDALRAGMPLAGVGCAIGRDALAALARTKPGGVPFSADCLTEVYELGLGISAMGRTARFQRCAATQTAGWSRQERLSLPSSILLSGKRPAGSKASLFRDETGLIGMAALRKSGCVSAIGAVH